MAPLLSPASEDHENAKEALKTAPVVVKVVVHHPPSPTLQGLLYLELRCQSRNLSLSSHHLKEG